MLFFFSFYVEAFLQNLDTKHSWYWPHPLKSNEILVAEIISGVFVSPSTKRQLLAKLSVPVGFVHSASLGSWLELQYASCRHHGANMAPFLQLFGRPQPLARHGFWAYFTDLRSTCICYVFRAVNVISVSPPWHIRNRRYNLQQIWISLRSYQKIGMSHLNRFWWLVGINIDFGCLGSMFMRWNRRLSSCFLSTKYGF